MVRESQHKAHFRPITPLSYEEQNGDKSVSGKPSRGQFRGRVKSKAVEVQAAVGVTGLKSSGTLLVIELGCLETGDCFKSVEQQFIEYLLCALANAVKLGSARIHAKLLLVVIPEI